MVAEYGFTVDHDFLESSKKFWSMDFPLIFFNLLLNNNEKKLFLREEVSIAIAR